MELTIFEILSIVGTIFGILGTALTIYFRWKATKPKQPYFLISNVRVTNAWNPRKDNKPQIIFKILFRNTGEKSTVFNIKFKLSVLTLKEQIISIRSYEVPLSPDQSHDKKLAFDIEENAKEWRSGSLEIMGYYLDRRDKKKKLREFYTGPNKEDEQWKKLFSIRNFRDRLFFIAKIKKRWKKQLTEQEIFISMTKP